ncbi:MAG: aminoglycoside phosphotransferase family protein [Oscillospiraceae bacterium]
MKLDKVIVVRSNKTIYRDGDLAIKVFNPDFSKADVLNEALNQARVEETGLNINRIHEVTKIDGKWAIISDFIEGKTLGELIKENPKDKEKYLNMFVDIQLNIHSKVCPLLSKLKDKMNRKIALTDLDATTRYEIHTRIESMPKHTKLCHGDFTLNNVIVNKDNVPYIIDWAHATQGNASADAARTYLKWCLSGDKNGAEEYLQLFCKKSDTARQYIQKWLPIVAASQLVKGKPEEKELLMSWIDVVEYE